MDEVSGNHIITRSNMRDLYLNHLNQSSYKIAKPAKKPIPPPLPAAYPSTFTAPDQNPAQVEAQSQLPPVYNINKSDFRDVVQKLTGVTAYDQFSIKSPALPVGQSKPSSFRLQKFRPPPLAQISNQPPNDGGQRAFSASPFPALPSMHMAADSPISAYLKSLSNLEHEPEQPKVDAATAYLRLISTSKYAPCPPVFPQPQMWNTMKSNPVPEPVSTYPMPLSPLPFGCSSPMSLYGMLSPSIFLSPTGQFSLPLSPLRSPNWNCM